MLLIRLKISSVLQNIRKSIKKAGRLSESYQPTLNSERYVTDKEVADILRLIQRTLQLYRTNRIIPYIMLGGKALYPESMIRETLEKAYKKAII